MKAILHLGTEKTGTSTIQRFLKENRENLMAQGFYFMKATGPADDRKLSVYCMEEGRFDDFHKNNLIDTEEKKTNFEKSLESQIAEEVGGLPPEIHTIIFSSEHFHSRVVNSRQRSKLQALLYRHFDEVELLSYLRPQIEVAVSHYSTALKTRSISTLEEYLQQVKVDNYYYDYYSYLSGWSSDFPDSEFQVRLFERSELVGGDVVTDFCQAVGLSVDSLQTVKPVNESVQPTGQELLREINKNLPTFVEGVGPNPARVALVQIITKMFTGKGQTPSQEQAKNLQEQFDGVNEKVRKAWFPERDQLFESSYEEYERKDPINSDVVVFFEDFLANYAKLNTGRLAGVPPYLIDQLRDIAVELESYNIEHSYNLMRIGKILRPNGDFIRKKIIEYEKKKS